MCEVGNLKMHLIIHAVHIEHRSIIYTPRAISITTYLTFARTAKGDAAILHCQGHIIIALMFEQFTCGYNYLHPSIVPSSPDNL